MLVSESIVVNCFALELFDCTWRGGGRGGEKDGNRWNWTMHYLKVHQSACFCDS